MDLNSAQMDFILESYALDTPGAKFARASEVLEKENKTTLLKQWTEKLIGKTKTAMTSKLRFDLPQQYQPVQPPVFVNKASKNNAPKI
ncbi:MAG: hypothetical protein KGI54_14970 [Pseudomonadota bacterium]|nr:hypothetical protein [Pseudomonadota bacterium]